MPEIPLVGILRSEFRRRRRRSIAIVMIMAFLILDIAFAWYIIAYSMDEKEAESIPIGFEIIDVARSFTGDIVVRGESEVLLLTPAGTESFQFTGTPSDIAIGDESMAVAILNSSGAIFYYEPGSFSPTFTVQKEGAWALPGIPEAYSTQQGRIPEQIAVLIANSTGSHLELLSIMGEGTVSWSRTFSDPISSYARSDYTAYIAIALENGSLYHFSRANPTPRQIHQLSDPVDELRLSDSGIKMGILHANGSKYSLMTTSSNEAQYTISLPDGCQQLTLNSRAESAFVLSGTSIVQIDETGAQERISREGIVTYTVPSVTDKIYISLPDRIEAFREDRDAPRWRAYLDITPNTMMTDAGGDVLVAYAGTSIAIIYDDDMPLGESTLWTALGFLVLGESAFLLIYGLWPQMRNARKETIYAVLIGAIAGLVVTVVFPEQSTLEWYGDLAIYSVLAAIVAALSTLLTLKAEAGLGGVLLGLIAGLMICIPIALVTHFLLTASGHELPGGMIHTMANTLPTGLKMGLLGGVVGYAAQKLI